ncbi:hypothetical protein [Hydrogenophaga sp. BPS33]|uniref:hypothetical protein n=1 Tax=Hydrogenophaga sp. BPS33 TaxID=2651974 RepID=UPI001359FF1C|nr:hypothetical protein [Hydrogenophaga sp. BPS33]
MIGKLANSRTRELALRHFRLADALLVKNIITNQCKLSPIRWRALDDLQFGAGKLFEHIGAVHFLDIRFIVNKSFCHPCDGFLPIIYPYVKNQVLLPHSVAEKIDDT